MQTIQSRDNTRVKHACRLAAQSAFRAGEGLFFAEGIRLCREMASVQRPVAAFFTQKALDAFPEAEHLAPEAFLVADHVAEKLATTKTSQGLFCVFETPKHTLDALPVQGGVLVCEAVADAVNVGALIRSAAGLGLSGVVLCGASADPFGPRALRAAMGACLRVPVVSGAAVGQVAAVLKNAGVVLYAAALQGAVAMGEVQVQKPFALLVGNEGAGLSADALSAADACVYIPMQRGVESLNVAAAAAVMMYHFKNA